MADKHARPLSKRKTLSLFSKIIPYTEGYSLEKITQNKTHQWLFLQEMRK